MTHMKWGSAEEAEVLLGSNDRMMWQLWALPSLLTVPCAACVRRLKPHKSCHALVCSRRS